MKLETKTPTAKDLQRWAQASRVLALSVVNARVVAETERARVDAYIAPVFARFTFTDDQTGAQLTTARQLYQCNDEVQVAVFFAACDLAHREQGFTGEAGMCPALIAEAAQIKAENALLGANA